MTYFAAARSPHGAWVEFQSADLTELEDNVLAAVAYGPGLKCTDQRVIHVGLRASAGDPPIEVWRANGPVEQGINGVIRYATNHELLFGTVEVDECDHGGLVGASEAAYRAISDFLARRRERHLLRMWNYFGSINEGEGDDERYKLFCLGRSRGLSWLPQERFPAGTAVGRRDRATRLQVCWLSACQPGQPVENPRQTKAYRYPRQYGPAPPSFCRAIVAPSGQLMISGTASIVGSQSCHPGSLQDQIAETRRNLRHLLEPSALMPIGASRRRSPGLWIVKAYLRDLDAAASVREALVQEFAGTEQVLLLEADICRAELLVEVECLGG